MSVTAEELTVYLRDNQNRLRNIAVRYTHEPEDALDLLQETMLRAYERIACFRTGDFGRWLNVMMRHLWVDRRRREARELSAKLRMVSNTIQPDDTQGLCALSDARRAMGDMSKNEQRALEMASAGLSRGLAAQADGVPTGTARRRLHTARKRLVEAI